VGVYDMLPKGSQVKCWYNDMRTVQKGDRVPVLGKEGYVVLLREGGYVSVNFDGVVQKIVEGRKPYYPEDFPGIACFDKWGCAVATRKDLIGQFQGLMEMDDPYHFK